MIPTSSIEYPGTQHFETIFEYSNFRVIEPSIRVLNLSFFQSCQNTVVSNFFNRKIGFNYD